MKRILLPLTLGLLLTLTACNSPVDAGRDDPGTPSPSTTVSVAPTVSVSPSPAPAEAPVWESSGGSCSFTDEDGTILVQGNFSLPRIQNADGVDAYAAINSWYEQLLSDLKSDTMANAAQAQDDYATSKALGDPFAGYSDEEIYEITHEDGRSVSILRTHFGYTSGPYPTLLYMADHFDLTTGVPLKFADFFPASDKAETFVRGEVARQAAGHDDYDQGAVATAFNREYFYLTEEGFVFYYQPQTLNPQAATKPEFLVTYDQLEEYLDR